MKKKLTTQQIQDIQYLIGAPLTPEFVFRNYLGWDDDKIREYRQMQLRDADHRYDLANTEANGIQVYNNKIFDVAKNIIQLDVNGVAPENAEAFMRQKMAEFWNSKTDSTNCDLEILKNDDK
jgi:hypothetical protein